LPGVPVGDAKRIFRGIELTARKQFTNTLWAQMSFLYSSLKGNYSGAIREVTGQTDPGINADYDYYQFTFNDYGNLELDRPVQARIDAVYNAPFGLSMGAQFYVRSGLRSPPRLVQRFYPANLYLEDHRDLRPDPDRLRPEPLARLQHGAGPGDGHPAVYVFNVLNRQTTSRSTATSASAPSSRIGEPFLRPAGSTAGNGHLRGLGHGSVLRTRTSSRRSCRRTRLLRVALRSLSRFVPLESGLRPRRAASIPLLKASQNEAPQLPLPPTY
jgi:hypothetical protein